MQKNENALSKSSGRKKYPCYHLNSGKARTRPGTSIPASFLTGDNTVKTY